MTSVFARHGYDPVVFVKKYGLLRVLSKIITPDPVPAKGSVEGPQKGIFLTGAYRSGTSWVGRVLSYADTVAFWREPYNPSVVPRMPRQYQYLTEHMEDDLYTCFTERLFSGHYAGSQFDHTIRSNWFRRPQRHFIKDPTAAFLLGWLDAHYDLDVIILVRHPAGFVSSVLALQWDFDLNVFLDQEPLMQDWLHPFRDLLERYRQRRMDVEKGALIWSVINFVLWKWIEKKGYFWVRYEDLCAEPLAEFKKLFAAVNLLWSERVEQEISASTSADITFSKSLDSGLERKTCKMGTIWKERLSEEDLQKIEHITAAFDLPFYSDYTV